MIAPDGYCHTQYLCGGGLCRGKELYEYKDGRLTKRTSFESLDRHSPFAFLDKHSHREISEESFAYENGRLASFTHTAGPAKILTRKTDYNYDLRGRLIGEFNKYPQQKLVYYPTHYDHVQYRYIGDSVYRQEYERGIAM